MMKNSKERGFLTLLIHFDPKESAYVGVCLQMNIVKVGKDQKQVENELKETVDTVLKLVRCGDLSEKVLNHRAPDEYWNMFKHFYQASESAPRFDAAPKNVSRDIEVKSYNPSSRFNQLCCV